MNDRQLGVCAGFGLLALTALVVALLAPAAVSSGGVRSAPLDTAAVNASPNFSDSAEYAVPSSSVLGVTGPALSEVVRGDGVADVITAGVGDDAGENPAVVRAVPSPTPTIEPDEAGPTERIVAAAWSEVGRDYPSDRFWCAIQVARILELAGVPWPGETSPARLHRNSPLLQSAPHVGWLVFIDLSSGTQPDAPVTHVGVVVSVDAGGFGFTSVEGNADPDRRRVTVHQRDMRDKDVVAFGAVS